MAYAVEFAETAVEDLENLVDSLEKDRRLRAIDEIERVCREFAGAPPLRSIRNRKVPTFPIHFAVDDVRYYWAGTFRISEDETTMVVTHVFRVSL